ncbi:polysaccharide deacetylase family protein [Anaeromyxobacter oryzae]|uniref:Polysaccharide deacetylase n=1 Tax=Anaeromyxobacter oryzae TaxID=2918170 RepID=A0ABN6MUH2_9BACT|nr:polysaccharide deacetylase family protein [Anaeromyxobacter oryzae]BDG04624.1 polysaccharide deacetylase [Anaeromyxobacter oryzae]
MTTAISRARLLARDALLEACYRTGATRPDRALRERLTIVTFHRVLPAELAREYPIDTLAVTTEELAWCLRFLADHFTCATLRDASRAFASGEAARRPWLAVTFDDGQRDNFEHALPVLGRAGVPATFFVPVDAVDTGEPLWHDRLAWAVARGGARDRTAAAALRAALGVDGEAPAAALVRRALDHAKRLDDRARAEFVARWEARLGGPARPAWDGMMTWTQVRALAAAGHEIGSHSMSHAILTSCDDRALERETRASRDLLRRRTGCDVESFCYPNGDHDARVLAAVRRAGYARAVTTRWGPNDRSAPEFALSRCDIQGRTSRSARGTLSPARLAWRLTGRSAPRSR